MNTIQLIGNICKDVELRVTQSGKKIIDNTIAVKKEKKNSLGEYESDFIKVVLFDYNAEYLSKYSKKGDKIGVVGKLRVDPYQDKEGNYKTDVYVIVDKVELLKSSEKKVEEPIAEPKVSPDDLPF